MTICVVASGLDTEHDIDNSYLYRMMIVDTYATNYTSSSGRELLGTMTSIVHAYFWFVVSNSI